MKNLAKLLTFLAAFLVLSQAFTLAHQNFEEQVISSKNLFSSQNSVTYQPAHQRLLQTSTGVIQTKKSNTKYAGIVLYHDIPTTFLIGQIFAFKGKLTTTPTSTAYVFLLIANANWKKIYKAQVNPVTYEFVLPVNTKEIPPGTNYQMGFNVSMSLAGGAGTMSSPLFTFTSAASQSIIAATPSTPTGISLTVIDNKLMLKWYQDDRTPLEKITFQQAGLPLIEYTLSNFQTSFQVPFKDFAAFRAGLTVTVTLASAYSSSLSQVGRISNYSAAWSTSFRAGNHAFAETGQGLAFTSTLPWTVSVGTNLKLTGFTTAIVNNIIVTEQPQFTIGKYKLTNSNDTYLPSGTTFNMQIPLTKEGVYILEINNNGGGAIMNRPIYVGNFLPLIPDFSDLFPDMTKDQIINAQPQTLQGQLSKLLTLVNAKRTEWGRATLTTGLDLQNVAQGHSNDMVARGYFSHYSPDNPQKGPGDRAWAAGIRYIVGENIAQNLDLVDAHNRLCRSPAHLANIVNQDFTKVGFGVAKDSQGNLLVTENFGNPNIQAAPPTGATSTPSSTPTSPTSPSSPTSTPTTPPPPSSTISSSQLQTIRTQVVAWMLKQYPTTKQDPTITNGVKGWISSGTTASIFEYFTGTVKYAATGYYSSTVTGPVVTDFGSLLGTNPYLKASDATYTKFGVGVKQASSSTVTVYALYAK